MRITMMVNGSVRSWFFGFVGTSAVVLVVGSVGCSMFGGEEGIQHSGAYTISPPREWRSQDHGEGDQAYRLPSGNLVTLTSSCDKDTRVPLALLTKQLLIGARHITVVKQTPLLVRNKEALYSSLHATYENVPFNIEAVVLTRESCIFDFTLLSPKPIPEKDLQQFLEFVKSFNYGKD
jgi:hypothetical protein